MDTPLYFPVFDSLTFYIRFALYNSAVSVKRSFKLKSPTRQTQSSGQSKKGQLFIVTLDIVEGNFGLLKVETKTGIGMYFDKKDLEKYEKIPGFLQIVDLHNKDGSVKLRNINSLKKFAAQGILFSFDEYEEEDEEDAVEKDVEDSGAGDTKKPYEDRMEEKGREIAAIIQQIAKPFPGSSISVVWGYLNNDAETEKKMSDVIGVAATDEIVAQMYNEHFEQETFKSDVAKAVINTYYNDAEVVSTTKRLVWIHKRLFNVDDS